MELSDEKLDFKSSSDPCGTPCRSLSSVNECGVLQNSLLIDHSRNSKMETPTHASLESSIMTPLHVCHNDEPLNQSTSLDGCAPDSNGSSDMSSPSGTLFRFTGFPASLPKVKPPNFIHKGKLRSVPNMTSVTFQKNASLSRSESKYVENSNPPGTIRKRMVFTNYHSDNEEDEDSCSHSHSIGSGIDHYIDPCDDSHNTSLSSLSVDLALRKTPARIQSRKIVEHMLPIMDTDVLSDDKNDRVLWLSPILSEEKRQALEVDNSDTDVGVNVLLDAQQIGGSLHPPLRTRLNFNAFTPISTTENSMDRKRQSFDEHDNNDDTTPARKLERKYLNGPHVFNPHRKDSFPPEITGPALSPFQVALAQKLSPTEENFRKELEKNHYSPIASALEDTELVDTMIGNDVNEVNLPKLNHATDTSNGSIGTCGNSTQSIQSSTTSKTKKLRPLPDISAFDIGSNATGSVDPGSESGVSSQHFCPPTPLRTPAWAHRNAFQRSNSLVSTKILAAVPSQMIDGFSSLEDSLLEDENNKCSTNPCVNSLDESFSGHVEQEISSNQSSKIDVKTSISLPLLKKVDLPTLSRRSSISSFRAITMDSSHDEVSAPISFNEDFDQVTKLGSGTFADVYKARWKADDNFYAVKRNKRQFRGKKDRERALEEIHIMQRLQNLSLTEWREASVRSKSSYCIYLLFFIRAWQEDGHLFSQTELCCLHTCRHLMMNLTTYWSAASRRYPSIMKNSNENTFNTSSTAEHLVPENTIWKICHDISCGMSHIHSHNIVHNDIKPLNIFFVLHPKLGAMCKIGDFGMAGEIGSEDDGQEGDPAYMPQELLDCNKKDPSGDIFSLGITLYELATPGHWVAPVDGFKWHEIRSEGHIPELPSSRSPELVSLIKRMISASKEKRPTADDILSDNGFINKAAIQEDEFLAEYIRDVDLVEKMRETEILKAMRHTPTPLQIRSNMRTPTPNSGPFL